MVEMSQSLLDKFKTEPITEKQAYAIDQIRKALGLKFTGSTKYDAWEFIGKYYKKGSSFKAQMNAQVVMDNESALLQYGRKLREEKILPSDFSY